MPALLGLIPGRLLAWAGAALVAIAVLLFLVGELKRAGKLEGQLDSAIELSNQNAEAAAHQAAETERLKGVDAENQKLKASLRRLSDQNRKAINNAPASDDGPIAPVLRRQLDSLRQPEGADARGAAAAPINLLVAPGAVPRTVPPRS